MNFDTSHFTPALGRVVLKHLLAARALVEQSRAEEIGVLVTPVNVENDLELIRRDREVCAASHGDEVGRVASSRRERPAKSRRRTTAHFASGSPTQP
jgi:hypothetical protein